MSDVAEIGLLHHENEGGARWRKVEQNSYRNRCSTTTRPRRGWGVEQAVSADRNKVEQKRWSRQHG